MKNTRLFLFLFLLTSFTLSQKGYSQSMPLKVSVLDESISFPNFWFTDYSFNPAIIIGTERLLKEKGNHDWHLTGNLGFYQHKDWQNGIFVNTEIAFRHHFGRLSVSPKLGIGYAHTFSPKPVYRFDNGEYRQVKELGNPTLMPSLSIELAFKINKTEQSPEVFLTFMESAEIPFRFYNGLHQFVGLGYKFYPFSE